MRFKQQSVLLGVLLLAGLVTGTQKAHGNSGQRSPDWQCATHYVALGLLQRAQGLQFQAALSRAQYAVGEYQQANPQADLKKAGAEIEQAGVRWASHVLDLKQGVVELDAKLKDSQISVVDRDAFTSIRARRAARIAESEAFLDAEVKACELRYGFLKESRS